MKPKILTEKKEYTFDYPEAIDFANTQLSIFWTPEEISVEKDIQDIRVNMTEAERHGVITTLKLFTLYELIAGGDYWSGKVFSTFPRPDIQRMANAFSFFEINVHAPFYNKLNESLGLDTDEFYSSYVDDPVLKQRMEFIDSIVNSEDVAASVLAFSFVEGVVLYSSFAFLKHFQSQGKNMLNNVVAGINFSVRDENLHSTAGAWLFKTLLAEQGKQPSDYYGIATKCADQILEHETQIINKIFEKGDIKGITAHQMIEFVKSRINVCFEQAGLQPSFTEVKYNPISSWFYKGINSIQFHDFFSRVGNEYNRNWDENKFVW